MNDGLTASDIMALKDDDGMNNWVNNPFIYLVWLALLGGGNGFFGNRDNGALQGALTRSDMFEGFNNQDVNSQLRGITNGLCDGFYAVNNSLKDGFYGTQATVKDGFYATQTGLMENRFAQQNCCCELKGGIKDLSAEGYRNTCEITTAIHAEGEATRALINANTMQELRDKLADRDRDLLYANFQNSQCQQNAYLVDALRPVSRPAYITCSPYATNQSYCASGFGGCGGA